VKTIGLIGGMSWESTASYYRIVNEEIRRRLGGFTSAKCILYSVDFGEIEQMQTSGDWEASGALLNRAAKSLEAAGADFFIVCTNTMHKVADLITRDVHIPFLHIADMTADAIIEKGIRSVGLLGTKYTMSDNFYSSRLEERGLEVIVPSASDQEIVNRIVYEELCAGVIKDSSRQEFKRVIASLIDKGIEGVVLGCTEIGLLISPDDVTIPVFDTAEIHALRTVDYALGDMQ
jgi:aspartate racemase